jgi:hypothetical protein
MGEYFRGWRRKIGVVTLSMACVVMVSWVRSLVRHDLVMIPWGNDTFCVESACGVIEFARLTTRDNKSKPKWFSNEITPTHWRWLDNDGIPRAVDHLGELAENEIDWRWDWGGFHFGAGHSINDREEDYMFPYWSIVVPLTLLSAFLLLSMPGKSTQIKILQPTANEGA